MKMLFKKNVFITILNGLLLGYCGLSFAHNQSGSFTTGLVSAVDYYVVSCSDDGNGAPAYLEAQVKDMTANSAKVNILVQKGTTGCSTKACAQFSIDTIDSDTGYSPLIKLSQASGSYNLYVSHTGSGTDSYDVSVHCKTATNLHTGTAVSAKQQQ